MSIESEKWMQEIPLNLHTVVSHFAALDASYCFLSKKHVKASLKHMYSLAKGILMNSRGETFSDDVFNMIIRIAPNTVLIRVLPFEKKSLELEFREYMQDRDRKKEKDNVPNPVQNKGTGVNPLFVIDSQSEKFSNILDQHELVLVPTGHTKKKIEERRSHFMKALKSLLDAFPTITRVSDLISHFRSDSIPIETSIEGAQSARPERISVTIGETTEATTGRRNDFANRLHSAHHSTIEALASAMVAGTSTIEYLGTDRGQSSVRGLVVYARETYEVHSPPGLPFPLSLVGTASWSPPVAASSPEPTPTSPDSSPKSPHSYISPTCALGDFPPAIPCINDTVESFLQAMPFFKDQVSDVISYEGRPPQFSELRTGMPDELKSALGTVGIRKFYRHQQMAIDHLMESSDHHVMISTSTSSGKSLCFLVPIMLNIINDPSSTSLLIFPTKALAQDQLRSITDMTKASTALSELIRPVIFDGDTSHAIRDTILQSKRNGTKGFVPPYNVILTNPDIMHATMLPLHKKWSHILRTMKIVVLDEAHVYRGVFGSHVALVLRRFRRLCAMYNNYPQFVACSATISNPLQLFRLLVPPLQARKRFEPFEAMPHVRNVITVSENQSRDREDDSRTILLIDSEIDGSMVGAKKLVIWNPSTLLGNNPIEHYTAAELKYSENMPGEINSKGKDPKERILNSSPVLATQTAAPTPSSPQTRRSSADDDTIDLTTPTQTPDRKPHATPESSRSSNPEARSLGTESQGADRRVPPPTHPSMPVAVHIRPPWGKLVGVLRARRVQLRAALEEANLHGAARSAPVDTLRLSQGVEEENEIEVSEAVKKLPAWAKRWIGSFGKDIYQRDSEFPQRASTLSDSAKLIVALTLAGLRTIVFVKSRRVAELVLQFVQERLSIADSAYIQYFLRTRGAQYQLTPEEEQVRPYAYINKIRGYRAGYLKENRRQLEREMFSGTLSTIIATNALELGIDIGSLDCSLLVGYPNSVSSLWQQSGRAGRGGRNNLTIVVAYDSPVDQLLVRNTRQLLGKGVEAAVSDPQNPKILKLHILSAAKELVLSPWDVQLFGDAMGTIVSHLRRLNMIVPVAKITSFDGYIDVVGSTITPTTGRRNLFEEIPRERLDFDELWLQYESVERRHEMLGESIHNELVNVTPASPGKGIVIDYKDSLNPSRGTSVSSTREERLLFDDEDELEDLSIGSQDFGGLSFSQIVSSQFVPRSNTEPKSPLNRGHRAKAAIGSGGSDSASDATSKYLIWFSVENALHRLFYINAFLTYTCFCRYLPCLRTRTIHQTTYICVTKHR